MQKSLKLSSLKTVDLVGIYNQISDKPIKKFTDRATAEARVALVLKDAKKQIVGTPEAPVLEDIEVKVRTTAHKATHGDDLVITLVADKNPKREGSDAHARFAQYKTGMTVRAYLDACAALGQKLPNGNAMPTFRFRGDLSWDEEHGYITFGK